MTNPTPLLTYLLRRQRHWILDSISTPETSLCGTPLYRTVWQRSYSWKTKRHKLIYKLTYSHCQRLVWTDFLTHLQLNAVVTMWLECGRNWGDLSCLQTHTEVQCAFLSWLMRRCVWGRKCLRLLLSTICVRRMCERVHVRTQREHLWRNPQRASGCVNDCKQNYSELSSCPASCMLTSDSDNLLLLLSYTNGKLQKMPGPNFPGVHVLKQLYDSLVFFLLLNYS